MVVQTTQVVEATVVLLHLEDTVVLLEDTVPTVDNNMQVVLVVMDQVVT